MGVDIIYFWDNPAEIESLSEAEIKDRICKAEAEPNPVKSNKMPVFSLLLQQYVPSLSSAHDLDFYNGLIQSAGEGNVLVRVVLPKEHNWILMRKAFVYARESGLMVFFCPLDFMFFPRGKVLPESMQKAVIEALDSPGIVNFMYAKEVVREYLEPRLHALTSQYGFLPTENKSGDLKFAFFESVGSEISVEFTYGICPNKSGVRLTSSVAVKVDKIHRIRSLMDFKDCTNPNSFIFDYSTSFRGKEALGYEGINGRYYEYMLWSIEHIFLEAFTGLKTIQDLDRMISNFPALWEKMRTNYPYNSLIVAAFVFKKDFDAISNEIASSVRVWEDARNFDEFSMRFNGLKKFLIDNVLNEGAA